MRLLDIESSEYNGVWKFWKLGSLALFACFVGVIVDVAVTLRRIARGYS